LSWVIEDFLKYIVYNNYSFKSLLYLFIMAIDDQLQKILNDVMKNPNNSMSSQEVINIENQGRDKRRHQVVTLYLMDKYG